jgi:hypothetical protein
LVISTGSIRSFLVFPRFVVPIVVGNNADALTRFLEIYELDFNQHIGCFVLVDATNTDTYIEELGRHHN